MNITMNEQSFYDYLLTKLKKDDRFLDEDGDIIRNAVIDKALKYDEQLLSVLIGDKKLKEVFFKELTGSLVFLQSTFIDYIQDKNFLIDSYTKYKNKIGLTIDGKYLNERGEVTLVWPFKDTVLEGGQTKEEVGRDIGNYENFQEFEENIKKERKITIKIPARFGLYGSINYSCFCKKNHI